MGEEKEKQEQSKEKTLKMIIVILSVLVVALSIFIIYDKVIKEENKPNNPVNNEIEDKEENNKEENDNQNEQEPTEKEEEKETLLVTKEEKEEIGIKIDNILTHGRFGVTSYKDSQKINDAYYYSYANGDAFRPLPMLFDTLTMTKMQKWETALYKQKRNPTAFDESEIDCDALLEFFQKNSIDPKTQNITQINALDVVQTYERYFGTKVEPIEHFSGGCDSYWYDATNKVYYYISGCGLLYGRFVHTYKYDYKKVDIDTVTVKLAAAFERVDMYPNNNQSDIYKDNDMKELYKENVALNSFEINDSNKDNFKTYLFTFKRNENNNFSFVSIEEYQNTNNSK